MFAIALISAVSFGEQAKDPNPYCDYDVAMQCSGDNPFAAVWQQSNRAYLAYNLADEKLAAFVADADTACALLAEVKDSWQTDPLRAEQVAAVTQWVMRPEPAWYDFFSPSPNAGRKIWTQALVVTAMKTETTYVKLFCLDQLRWCGYACPRFVGQVRAIAVGGDKSVGDFAEVVVRELEGKGIGRD